MPNRILKESICTSDEINKLTWFEESLFYRLIVNSDDYGRFDGRTAIIRGRLFPLKENVTVKAISEAVRKLAIVGLVMPYECDGKPYLQLLTWDKHQQKRANNSKYPEPDINCNQMIADDINCNQLQSNVTEKRESIYEKRESINDNMNSGSAAESDLKTEFEELWALYPRKQGKVKALAAYKRARNQGTSYETVKRGIEAYKEQIAAKHTEMQYIKQGATFFNNQSWTDEYDTTPQKRKSNSMGNFSQREESYGDGIYTDLSELEV